MSTIVNDTNKSQMTRLTGTDNISQWNRDIKSHTEGKLLEKTNIDYYDAIMGL